MLRSCKSLATVRQIFQQQLSDIADTSAATWRVGWARSYAHPPDRLKVWKPTSPGQRGRITVDRYNLWKERPYKALTEGIHQTGGRNNSGRISVWHKGGGAKRLYRIVDFFHRGRCDGVVERIEYDPNRSARIALVKELVEAPAEGELGASGGTSGAVVVPKSYHGDGAERQRRQELDRDKRWRLGVHRPPTAAPGSTRQLEYYKYMLAPEGVGVGDVVSSKPGSPIKPGMTMPLKSMPAGTLVHNVELQPGRGGQMCRSAGTNATLVKNEDDGYTVIRLPSGEMRKVLSACNATVGTVGNSLHKNRKLGKAGISRHLGIRPTTRALAMNPRDHPAGGKAKKLRKTPWGKNFMGVKTRDKKKPGARFILLTRHKAKELRKR